MADTPLDWKLIRAEGLKLAARAAACALIVPFGYATYLGLSQPQLAGPVIFSRASALVADPLIQWALRDAIALLALLQGVQLARRASEENSFLLGNTFVMALGALGAVVVLRLALDLIFQTPQVVQRAVLDALGYAAALGLALLGAWLGRRRGKGGSPQEPAGEGE
jgi:hypothetical protein